MLRVILETLVLQEEDCTTQIEDQRLGGRPTFAQTDQFYDDDEFVVAEYELLEESLRNAPGLRLEAIRHIREGFNRRLLMMQCSRIKLREKTKRAGDQPLNPYEVEELNVHLNSYYLNLRGCFDNLAWALNYQFSIVEAEESRRNRSRCNLFGKEFLDALDRLRPTLRQSLRNYEEWAAELKKLRDPAAHRLPLSVVGGCLPTDSTSEFQKLWAKAAAPRSELGGKPRSYFVQQAYALLEYEPLIAVGTASGQETRKIPVQLGNDHRLFLDIARHVLNELWVLPIEG